MNYDKASVLVREKLKQLTDRPAVVACLVALPYKDGLHGFTEAGNPAWTRAGGPLSQMIQYLIASEGLECGETGGELSSTHLRHGKLTSHVILVKGKTPTTGLILAAAVNSDDPFVKSFQRTVRRLFQDIQL